MKNLELKILQIGQWGRLWIKISTLKQPLETILVLVPMISNNNWILKENIFQANSIAQVQRYGILPVPNVSINQLLMLQARATIIRSIMIYLTLENMFYPRTKETEREDLLDPSEIPSWISLVNKLKVIVHLFSPWSWKIPITIWFWTIWWNQTCGRPKYPWKCLIYHTLSSILWLNSI